MDMNDGTIERLSTSAIYYKTLLEEFTMFKTAEEISLFEKLNSPIKEQPNKSTSEKSKPKSKPKINNE